MSNGGEVIPNNSEQSPDYIARVTIWGEEYILKNIEQHGALLEQEGVLDALNQAVEGAKRAVFDNLEKYPGEYIPTEALFEGGVRLRIKNSPDVRLRSLVMGGSSKTSQSVGVKRGDDTSLPEEHGSSGMTMGEQLLILKGSLGDLPPGPDITEAAEEKEIPSGEQDLQVKRAESQQMNVDTPPAPDSPIEVVGSESISQDEDTPPTRLESHAVESLPDLILELNRLIKQDRYAINLLRQQRAPLSRKKEAEAIISANDARYHAIANQLGVFAANKQELLMLVEQKREQEQGESAPTGEEERASLLLEDKQRNKIRYLVGSRKINALSRFQDDHEVQKFAAGEILSKIAAGDTASLDKMDDGDWRFSAAKKSPDISPEDRLRIAEYLHGRLMAGIRYDSSAVLKEPQLRPTAIEQLKDLEDVDYPYIEGIDDPANADMVNALRSDLIESMVKEEMSDEEKEAVRININKILTGRSENLKYKLRSALRRAGRPEGKIDETIENELTLHGGSLLTAYDITEIRNSRLGRISSIALEDKDAGKEFAEARKLEPLTFVPEEIDDPFSEESEEDSLLPHEDEEAVPTSTTTSGEGTLPPPVKDVLAEPTNGAETLTSNQLFAQRMRELEAEAERLTTAPSVLGPSEKLRLETLQREMHDLEIAYLAAPNSYVSQAGTPTILGEDVLIPSTYHAALKRFGLTPTVKEVELDEFGRAMQHLVDNTPTVEFRENKEILSLSSSEKAPAPDAVPEPVVADSSKVSGEKTEVEKEINAAETLTELRDAIRKYGPVSGTGKTYDAEELIDIISLVEAGSFPVDGVTRTLGIRDAVLRILRKSALAHSEGQVIEETTTPEPADSLDNPVKENTATLAERALGISETVENKFKAELGVTFEQLAKIEGFRSLSEGQQLLVLRNMHSEVLQNVEKDANKEQKAEWKGRSYWGRVWRGAATFGSYQFTRTKSIQKELLARAKGGDAADPQRAEVLADHIVNIEEYVKVVGAGPDVEVKEGGELEIKYASLNKVLGSFEAVKATPEDAAVVESFNKTASEFAKLPREWGYEPKDEKEKGQREKYEAEKVKLDAARAGLLALYEAKFTEKGEVDPEKAAMLEMHRIDENLQVNQLFNAHPNAEQALENIEGQNVIWAGVKEFIRDKGKYIALGMGTRIAAGIFLGTVTGGIGAIAVASGVGLGVGAAQGRAEAKKLIRERRIDRRMSLEDEREEISYKKYKYKLNNENQPEYILDERGDRIVVSSGIRKIKEYTDATVFTDRIERLTDKLNEAKTAKERGLLESKIAKTTALAEEKYRLGLINFGGSSLEGGEERKGNDIANKLSFIQAIGKGAAVETVDPDKLKQEIDNIVGSVTRHQDQIEKVRDEEVTTTWVKAAMVRAGFALGGSLIADAFHEHSIVHEVYSKIFAHKDGVIAASAPVPIPSAATAIETHASNPSTATSAPETNPSTPSASDVNVAKYPEVPASAPVLSHEPAASAAGVPSESGANAVPSAPEAVASVPKPSLELLPRAEADELAKDYLKADMISHDMNSPELLSREWRIMSIKSAQDVLSLTKEAAVQRPGGADEWASVAHMQRYATEHGFTAAEGVTPKEGETLEQFFLRAHAEYLMKHGVSPRIHGAPVSIEVPAPSSSNPQIDPNAVVTPKGPPKLVGGPGAVPHAHTPDGGVPQKGAIGMPTSKPDSYVPSPAHHDEVLPQTSGERSLPPLSVKPGVQSPISPQAETAGSITREPLDPKAVGVRTLPPLPGAANIPEESMRTPPLESAPAPRPPAPLTPGIRTLPPLPGMSPVSLTGDAATETTQGGGFIKTGYVEGNTPRMEQVGLDTPEATGAPAGRLAETVVPKPYEGPPNAALLPGHEQMKADLNKLFENGPLSKRWLSIRNMKVMTAFDDEILKQPSVDSEALLSVRNYLTEHGISHQTHPMQYGETLEHYMDRVRVPIEARSSVPVPPPEVHQPPTVPKDVPPARPTPPLPRGNSSQVIPEKLSPSTSSVEHPKSVLEMNEVEMREHTRIIADKWSGVAKEGLNRNEYWSESRNVLASGFQEGNFVKGPPGSLQESNYQMYGLIKKTSEMGFLPEKGELSGPFLDRVAKELHEPMTDQARAFRSVHITEVLKKYAPTQTSITDRFSAEKILNNKEIPDGLSVVEKRDIEIVRRLLARVSENTGRVPAHGRTVSEFLDDAVSTQLKKTPTLHAATLLAPKASVFVAPITTPPPIGHAVPNIGHEVMPQRITPPAEVFPQRVVPSTEQYVPKIPEAVPNIALQPGHEQMLKDLDNLFENGPLSSRWATIRNIRVDMAFDDEWLGKMSGVDTEAAVKLRNFLSEKGISLKSHPSERGETVEHYLARVRPSAQPVPKPPRWDQQA